MIPKKSYIAPQKMDRVHQVLGTDLCRAMDWLANTLYFGFSVTGKGRKREASPREYAELREAKSQISYLKYPDPTEPVRQDEMAWALKLIRDSYCTEAHEAWGAVFEKAALILGIDLSQKHPIPDDLEHKIANELQLLSPRPAEVPMAKAPLAAAV